MSFNEMWPVYIIGSLDKYFSTALTGYKFYTIGEEPRLNTVENYYWLRVDGPEVKLETANKWRLEVVVNLLMTSFNERDLYKLEKLIGLGAKAFINQIAVYQIPTDPLTQVGCLQLKSDQLDVHRYGQMKPETKMLQASVEAIYAIDL